MGISHILACLRKKYWILQGMSAIKRLLHTCIFCQRINSRPCEQQMAPLPEDRITPCRPPFHATGIDYFGPFYVKYRRGTSKRYGIIFSCLASRAVHLEVAVDLEMSSFLNAFRRFCSRRIKPVVIYSDNGTNLTSGCSELKKELQKIKDSNIDEKMKIQEIDWHFNPPSASHFGGIYEREIRTVRKVLQALMNEQHLRVDLSDDSLQTLMCEVEAILNNRPLTPLSNDPNDLDPLTPNHLLKLGSPFPFAPCITENCDLYGKRRWKQVQYLTDIFWTRWIREYIPILQARQKWTKKRIPLKIGDLVLVTDQLLPRNQWRIGRITQVFPSHDGSIRKAQVAVARLVEGKKLQFKVSEILRPVAKLVLLRVNE